MTDINSKIKETARRIRELRLISGISVEEMAKEEFVNEYDDELIPGYGVVNNFTYDEDEGWVWTQLKDNSQADE